jgi:antitoxin component of MazEF toxin-antitoxin module
LITSFVSTKRVILAGLLGIDKQSLNSYTLVIHIITGDIMETIAKPKKWGNSIGIIIPRNILEAESITLDDELIVHVEKKEDFDKKKLMKEGYIEMKEESEIVNKEWESADFGS